MFLKVVRESATVLLRLLIDLKAIKDEKLSVQIMICWFVFSLHTYFQLPITILVVALIALRAVKPSFLLLQHII